jgi:tRNA uridine 5-carboxymethylaminomethyl modification enzyme
MNTVIEKKKQINEIINILHHTKLEPSEIVSFLLQNDSSAISEKTKASQILLRPGISLANLLESVPVLEKQLKDYNNSAIEQAEIQIKYEVYLRKEEEMISKMSGLEEQIIPDSFNYENISSLSNEARQKFKKIRPQTLGQASRISGVNPSDVQILMVYMGR